MARGGARPGAGRLPGSKNKLTVAARQLAESSGSLPHEVLLLICRGEVKLRDVVKQGDQFVEIERWPTVDERIRAAAAAAPFYAPKFAAQTLVVQSSAKSVIDELMEAVTASPMNRARPSCAHPPAAVDDGMAGRTG